MSSSVRTRKFLWLLLVPVGTVVAALLFFFWLFWWPNTFRDAEEAVVVVSRGASFTTIVDSLESAGVIRSRNAFELAGRILGLTTSLRVGRYHFKSGMSNIQLLYDLRDGTSNRPVAVRIPEGARLHRIAARVARDVGVDSSRLAQLCADASFIATFGLAVPTLEGYLLPNTYNFFWQTDEEDILRRLVNAFQEFYVDSLVRRQEQLGFTLHEVVTLASIVEGETSLDSERATIAGVYHNRLRIGMLLQADPTIQYVIPDGPRRLFYEDLKIASPYNTYRHRGLPPGPINNPGAKSILAALYPEQHQYLYFVADGTGGHRFSKTYPEHLRAVREWRRIRRDVQLNSAGSR